VVIILSRYFERPYSFFFLVASPRILTLITSDAVRVHIFR